MYHGYIFTKDKKEIDVFFLKQQVPPELNWQLGHQIGDGSHKNPIIVDDETGDAFLEDMTDDVEDVKASEPPCKNWTVCQDLHLLTENVDENSNDDVSDEAYVTNDDGIVTEIKGCCPTGHKGESGTVGVKEGEEELYEILLETLKKFDDTGLSLKDESCREILSISITRKIMTWAK
ncbi:MAG: hypothetical protein CMI54_07370 [Parcubacteria group bacterium]|nr:hypothetical protein [Parcubacteria group bacterium]|tara:strand:- start:3808 stop:4338 length:531 start_codon:yes stop_codon:yes gene_type:complete